MDGHRSKQIGTCRLIILEISPGVYMYVRLGVQMNEQLLGRLMEPRWNLILSVHVVVWAYASVVFQSVLYYVCSIIRCCTPSLLSVAEFRPLDCKVHVEAFVTAVARPSRC